MSVPAAPIAAARNPSDPMRVLVVEDEPRLREMLLSAIPTMGFETFAARSGEDGLRAMEEHPCEMVVLDLNLPGMDGLEFFERLREKWPMTQVVVVTGFGDLDAAKKAIRLNVADFLTKPTPLGDLEQALDRARRKWVQAMQTDETMLRPLPDLSQSEPAAEKAADAAESEPLDETQPATLEEIERRHILAALDRNNGNRAATAKELGISVRKLYYRISQYQDEGRI